MNVHRSSYKCGPKCFFLYQNENSLDHNIWKHNKRWMCFCACVCDSKFEDKQIKSNSENGKKCNGNKQTKNKTKNKVMALWSRVGKRSMVGANSNYENQHAMTYRRKPSFNPLSPPWSRCRRRLCTIRLITVIVVPIFFLFENGSEKMIEKTIFKMINEMVRDSFGNF